MILWRRLGGGGGGSENALVAMEGDFFVGSLIGIKGILS